MLVKFRSMQAKQINKNIIALNYRADIDGLRTFAVLAVIFFHAFPDLVLGGFTGVDVFFVISGFLISTILYKGLDGQAFSFIDFYIRRIRRIFPALIFVLTACYVFGWFALLEDEYKQLGLHTATSAGFVSNLVFWSESGYFDNATETKPLLHLWSLAIEEQFYIFWPILLWQAWRRNFSFLLLILFLLLASFALNIIEVGSDASLAFFSTLTRCWELLAGSLLAWMTIYKKDHIGIMGNTIAEKVASSFDINNAKLVKSSLANILSMIGFLILSCGFLYVNSGSNFPGWFALIPVIGSLVLILSGPSAFFNRTVLSNKVVVYLGVISFPLYLWHWPLLSFARIIESQVPSTSFRIAAIVVSILLAWITHKFVERPFRYGGRGKFKSIFMTLFLVILGFVGYSTYTGNGFGFRSHARLNGLNGDIGHLHYHKYIQDKYFLCTPEILASEALKWDGVVRCMQSKPSSDIDIALVGDSHAEHLFTGIAEALPSKNIVFYIKDALPITGNQDFNNIFNVISKSETIKTVVITAHWFVRSHMIPPSSSLEAELLKVADFLTKTGKKVYLVDDVPSFIFSPEKCKGKRWLATRNPSCEMDALEYKNQTNVYINSLKSVAQLRPSIKLLNVGRYLCDDRVCKMSSDDKLLYRDAHHLNLYGSLYIGEKLVKDNPKAWE